MTQQEIVSYWIGKARDELDSANIMFNANKHLYAGFMCHQAIEKALKARYIYLKDDRQPYEHNLERLSKMTDLFDKMTEEQRNTMRKLVPLYINARYEDYKNVMAELLTSQYCKKLILDTEVLLTWILHSMTQRADS